MDKESVLKEVRVYLILTFSYELRLPINTVATPPAASHVNDPHSLLPRQHAAHFCQDGSCRCQDAAE
jgi:hypothetical protein